MERENQAIIAALRNSRITTSPDIIGYVDSSNSYQLNRNL